MVDMEQIFRVTVAHRVKEICFCIDKLIGELKSHNKIISSVIILINDRNQ